MFHDDYRFEACSLFGSERMSPRAAQIKRKLGVGHY